MVLANWPGFVSIGSGGAIHATPALQVRPYRIATRAVNRPSRR
ncbi:hypothetical protein BURCENBC7_AP3596 [Burkholderia cenocepacia BC7]|nr:hypothetical protein BURCENK562V_C4517 [Burkholderia cenocepacia K56-2Valvano]ERI27821.1 hypothetical protein BURCENBC7_AP3596 [Burkholderia cenocepacia BC7]